MELHPDISEDDIIDAVERGMFGLCNPGFCNFCGLEADGCEPDATNYVCESCGEYEVFGAEHLLACCL